MAQQIEDVPAYAGDTLEITLHLSDDDGPLDLSTWEWKCQWRVTPTAGSAVELTVDDTNSATGTLVITGTPEQTRQLTTKGVCDLQGTQGELVRTWLWWNLLGTQDVTRV